MGRKYFRDDNFFKTPFDGEIIPLKFLCIEHSKYGANEAAEEENHEDPRYIRITDIDEKGELRNDTFKSLSLDIAENYLLKDGDILFARSGATVGKTLLYKTMYGPAVYAGYLVKYRLDLTKCNPEFINYCTKSKGFELWLKYTIIEATIENISGEKYANLPLPVPLLTQQNKIVDYLNKKVSKIDALIEKKIQLITILEEKKKAVINKVVTKGLDSNVSMKDSEIEWLGDIPEHWKIVKLKYLTSKIGDGLHSTPEYTPDEDYYFINGVNLKNGKIEYNNKTNTVSFEEFLKYKIDFSEKTLFLSLNGTIGNIALYNNENIILGKSAAFIDLVDDTLCDRFFLYYILQSQVVQQYFEMSLSGTTIKNLSLFTLRNTPLVLPDMDSQLNIVKYLNKELDKLDYLNSRINNSIELLKEQRAAIISAAVNGELNVN